MSWHQLHRSRPDPGLHPPHECGGCPGPSVPGGVGDGGGAHDVEGHCAGPDPRGAAGVHPRPPACRPPGPQGGGGSVPHLRTADQETTGFRFRRGWAGVGSCVSVYLLFGSRSPAAAEKLAIQPECAGEWFRYLLSVTPPPHMLFARAISPWPVRPSSCPGGGGCFIRPRKEVTETTPFTGCVGEGKRGEGGSGFRRPWVVPLLGGGGEEGRSRGRHRIGGGSEPTNSKFCIKMKY